MATTLQLRSNIKKLKKALEAKGISPAIKSKLKAQLDKAESELASSKKSGKAPKASVVKGGTSSLSKLQKLIQKKKYAVYQGQGVDLERDSDRPAKPTGKRKSKSGKTYYEYRANRIDVKQPPKTRPRLEEGGYMANGGSTKNKYQIASNYWRQIEESMTPRQKSIYRDTYKRLENKFDNFNDRHIAQYIQGSINENFDDSFKLTHYEISGANWFKLGYKYIAHNDAIHEPDWWEYASGGYMAKGGKLSLSEFKEKYDDNEDNNMHSENVVLLAENFGTDSDIRDAKTILAKHEAIGSLPSYLQKERDELGEKLWKKYQEAKYSKEEGGYMAKGGETHRYEKGGYMAKGGVTEHGLKVGDLIVSDLFWENSVVVKNQKDGLTAKVNLGSGERKEAKI